MKTRILKSILFVLTASSIFVCCVNDDYKEPESSIKTYELTTNQNVAAVKAMAPNIPNTNPPTNPTGPKVLPTLYNANDVIEAYVTSSDETGNFYNSISLQTIPTDGSAPIGFSVSVDLKSSTEGFTPGRKVYIKLKGLYIGNQYGSLKIGSLYQDDELGRIANYDWKKYLFPSSTIVAENTFVRTVSLAQAALDVNINTLLEINNIQFSDESLLRTYYDVDNGGSATNHKISDVNGSISKFLRVSEFSLFASQNIPFGKGKIRGVMSKFNNDYQFIIRSTDDVKLNTPRVYNYPSSINENFNSYPITSSYSISSYIAFSNYINFFSVGKKNWFVKSGGYLEMSAFGGDVENAKSYFIMPVNMTDANTLQFKINTSFYTGGLGLKVYRTTNYVPGTSISKATLTDITGFFTLPTNSTSFTSTPVFVNSGVYNIPSGVIGNGYFVFEYSGTNVSTGPPLTTSVDIDDIVIN